MSSAAKTNIVELLEQAAPGQTGRFTVDALDELKQYGLSPEEIYRFVAPRRTLARRAEKGQPLTVEESDNYTRILHICQLAERVFDNWDKANGWLREPCRALNGVVPFDLLEAEQGARLVEEELIRIEHGIFF
ncbi:DUF2384 domain-containing protein [Pseudomonas sp. R2.Fl]|nr:DUF2384 domain-containing protein [Pseudomonas sp. R2.Fl]